MKAIILNIHHDNIHDIDPKNNVSNKININSNYVGGNYNSNQIQTSHKSILL